MKSNLRSIEASKSALLISARAGCTLLATIIGWACAALVLSHDRIRMVSRAEASVSSQVSSTRFTSAISCGKLISMLRGRSITVISNAWRNSSSSCTKAAPSVISGWLIGASAERIDRLSFARTMARSINSGSMRLGFSIASVRPRPGSRSSDSAPVPKWTSRSSSAVGALCCSLNSHASEVASVEAPTPPRVPTTAVEMCRRADSESPPLGAMNTASAWLSASCTCWAESGLSR